MKKRTRPMRVPGVFTEFLEEERIKIQRPISDADLCVGLIREIKQLRRDLTKPL